MASASCAGPLPPLGSSPRAGSSPFEAGRAVVAELLARVEGFAFAVSVDNPDDTSLRTPAAGVHLSTARLVFGSFGQRVHRAPFHGFENAARRPLRDDGARAPRPRRATLVTDGLPLSPGGAAGALARRTLAAAEAQAAALRLAFPVLVTFRIRLYRLGGNASGCSFDIVADAHWSVMPGNGCFLCH
jgi:hypothetical protein